MRTIEWRGGVNRKDWPAGEWDNEPDKKQWLDKTTGLPCLIVRNNYGTLCGYVGVPKSHPLHGKGYQSLYDDNIDIDVHGGLTFSDGCQTATEQDWQKRKEYLSSEKAVAEAERFPEGDTARYIAEFAPYVDDFEGWLELQEGHSVCHVVDGEDAVWWLGFDCAHSGDLSPGIIRFEKLHGIGPSPYAETYKNMAYVTEQVESLAKQLATIQ
jgi:hypothetical protein